MKIAGWICIILGGISLFGAIIGGSGAIGPLFFLGLGIALINGAKQKKEKNNEQKTDKL